MINKQSNNRVGITMPKRGIPFMTLLLFCFGCAVGKYIPEGEYFYLGTKKIHYQDEAKPDNNGDRAKEDLGKLLAYKPNGSLFGSSSLRIPFTYPFWINKNLKNSKTAFGRWISKNFGKEPILISTVNPDLRAQLGTSLLKEYGYFSGSVSSQVELQGKDSIAAKAAYEVTFGPPTLMDSIRYELAPTLGDSSSLYPESERLIHKGDPLGVIALENERIRISKLLRDKGYFYFKPEMIQFLADTLRSKDRATIVAKLSENIPPEAYEPWNIGSINVTLTPQAADIANDSLKYKGLRIKYFGKRPPIRPSVLLNSIKLKTGQLYNQSYQEATLEALSDLNAFAYSNVSYTPRTTSEGQNLLDVQIAATLAQPYSTEFNAVYKFKSNNQTGPGLGFTLNRNNLFRGGELLSLEASGSYEWETRPSSSSSGSKLGINSYEFKLSGALTFPRLLLPYLYYRNIPYPNHTRVALSGTLLNRSNFYGQSQFGGELSYRFEPRTNIRHTIQLLSLTYNHLLYETDRFREALDRNPGLSLSFQNQFIPQISYLYNYEYQDPLSKNFLSLEGYFSEAGGLLSLAYAHDAAHIYQNHRFLKALFAQYVKGYGIIRYGYKFSPSFSIASRLYAGAVWSYGNTGVTPYTEQFYAGGANSLRGFNVRSVGPGAYIPEDELPLSFLDKTGDMRLEANLELRYKVIGNLELATFLDAGNIWLLRPDPSKPNGTLQGKYFFNDLALNTGLGLRYDLTFLVLRLDLGLALHRPDRVSSRYFNTFGAAQQPYALHLAIGYPF